MDEEEARRRLVEASAQFAGPLEVRPLSDGRWVALRLAAVTEGVVLRPDGSTTIFLGALGKLVPILGLPLSGERILGSARQGRYQLFESGLGVWESLEKIGDIGFPVAKWDSSATRAKRSRAVIAVFDLRGFTKWSESNSNDPDAIQNVVEDLEKAFQDSFADGRWATIFAKGTGDGFMIVAELPGAHADHPEHVRSFCQACASTISAGRRAVPSELAIGCGVTIGDVTQVFVLGRADYLGPAINEASKIQAIAYNELCIADEVVQLLRSNGGTFEGWLIPGKGLRIGTDAFVDRGGTTGA